MPSTSSRARWVSGWTGSSRGSCGKIPPSASWQTPPPVSLIESVADDLSDEISDAEGGRTTRRFSCGYADFPLEQQTDFMRLLDMGRKLGVFIGADYLMTPQKTVTAVIGVRGEREEQ